MPKILKASEVLKAGHFVNLHTEGDVRMMRKACAKSDIRPAHGFVLQDVEAGFDAPFHTVGEFNDRLVGLREGAQYSLSSVPGELVEVADETEGSLLQPLGEALSENTLFFLPWLGVVL